MKTVVQIGAGAIGRGFLGQLWCEGGYETVFVDVSETLVAELNRRGSYPLRLITTNGETTREIGPVRAIRANDTDAVGDALASCTFAATAVGVRHLGNVARSLILPAMRRRGHPLNVLLCENGSGIRDSFLAGAGTEATGIHPVETVVGRMVPEAGRGESDPLTVSAESYRELPFNRSQWHGDPPHIPGLIAVHGEQFHAYEMRKLFLHNGGHASLAYHGFSKGHHLISDCARDETLVAELRGFWAEVATALRRSEHRDGAIFAPGVLEEFTEDLLHRFQNPLLGDTVARVGRDPLRKLAPGERLAGAAVFCQDHGVAPEYASRAIAAALHFAPPEDTGAAALRERVQAEGVRAAASGVTGIAPDSPIILRVVQGYESQTAN